MDTLQRALDSAKVAYEAHIQSASRETLKALADLRKTVIEETQKVTQRAQDMTSGLSRDLAVTAAPFVLRIFSDVSRAATPWVSAAFYFFAAGFIALSFALQWRINKAFFRSQKISRRRWMQTLYTYVSEREREEIAETPIEQAVASYRETRLTLLFIYIILAGILISAGLTALPITFPKSLTIKQPAISVPPQPSNASPAKPAPSVAPATTPANSSTTSGASEVIPAPSAH